MINYAKNIVVDLWKATTEITTPSSNRVLIISAATLAGTVGLMSIASVASLVTAPIDQVQTLLSAPSGVISHFVNAAEAAVGGACCLSTSARAYIKSEGASLLKPFTLAGTAFLCGFAAVSETAVGLAESIIPASRAYFNSIAPSSPTAGVVIAAAGVTATIAASSLATAAHLLRRPPAPKADTPSGPATAVK